METSRKIPRSSRLKSCGGRRIVLEADFWRRRLRILLPIRGSAASGCPPLFLAGRAGPREHAVVLSLLCRRNRWSGLLFWSEVYGPKFDKQFDK